MSPLDYHFSAHFALLHFALLHLLVVIFFVRSFCPYPTPDFANPIPSKLRRFRKAQTYKIYAILLIVCAQIADILVMWVNDSQRMTGEGNLIMTTLEQAEKERQRNLTAQLEEAYRRRVYRVRAGMEREQSRIIWLKECQEIKKGS